MKTPFSKAVVPTATKLDRVSALEAELDDLKQQRARIERHAVINGVQPDFKVTDQQIAETEEQLTAARAQAAYEAEGPARLAAYDRDEALLFAEANTARKRLSKQITDLLAEFDQAGALFTRIDDRVRQDNMKPIRFKHNHYTGCGLWFALLRATDLVDALKRWQRDSNEVDQPTEPKPYRDTIATGVYKRSKPLGATRGTRTIAKVVPDVGLVVETVS